MSHADKLRDLVDNVWPAQVSGIDQSITKMTDQQTEIQEQIDAVEWSRTQAKNDQDSRLTAKGYDYTYTESTYGISDLSTFHLADEISITDSPTYIDVDSFSLIDDQTSLFSPGQLLLISLGTSYVIRIVSSAVYTTLTTITLTVDVGNPITSGITTPLREIKYQYEGIGWDSDTDIISNIEFFEDSYKHLHDELGTNGTYGLYPLKTGLTTGLSVQQNNKTSYQNFISIYDKYGT